MTADGTGFNTNEAQHGRGRTATPTARACATPTGPSTPTNTPDTALGFVCTSCLAGTRPLRPAGPLRGGARRARRPGTWWRATCTARAVQPTTARPRSSSATSSSTRAAATSAPGTPAPAASSSERLRRHQRLHAVARRGRRQRQPQRRHAAHDGDLQRLQPPRHRLRHPDAAATAAAPAARPRPPTLTATAGQLPGRRSPGTRSPGATRYWVFRTEGHAGCNFGKTLIAEVTGTQLHRHPGGQRPHLLLQRGGRGRLHRPATAAPATASTRHARAGSPTPDFSVSCSPSSLTVPAGQQRHQHLHRRRRTDGFNSAVSLSLRRPAGRRDLQLRAQPGDAAGERQRQQHADGQRVGTAATGTFTFQAQGTSGATHALREHLRSPSPRPRRRTSACPARRRA